MKRITKKHLDGTLKGMETKEITYHGFKLNKIYSCCVTGDSYKIIKIEDV